MLNYTGKIDRFAELEKAYSVVIIDLGKAKQEVVELTQKNLALEQENTYLKEQLLLLQGKKFGKSSEAHLGEPIISSKELENKIVSVIAHTRKKAGKSHGRLIDTSSLIMYTVYHELDDEHKNCINCRQALVQIGQDTSEQLEVLPMQLYVVKHVRYKYACRPCQAIIMAPKPASPIPKSLAGGSLLAEVIINKYQYHLPLYRQSKIFDSYGSTIPDNTLGNWVMVRRASA
ncbi:MAG: IS66 family transposase zinc-finger binding domain-containing protein [Methanobacteriaceae archaeon]